MIQAVARAHHWRKLLDRKEVKTLAEITTREKLGPTYVSRIFELSLLAPDIVTAILDGRQPPGLSLRELAKGIPMLWAEQRERFGFSSGWVVTGLTGSLQE